MWRDLESKQRTSWFPDGTQRGWRDFSQQSECMCDLTVRWSVCTTMITGFMTARNVQTYSLRRSNSVWWCWCSWSVVFSTDAKWLQQLMPTNVIYSIQKTKKLMFMQEIWIVLMPMCNRIVLQPQRARCIKLWVHTKTETYKYTEAVCPSDFIKLFIRLILFWRSQSL